MPTAPKSQLTKSEQLELATCEATIDRGLQNFIEVGNALLAVSDKRLYRQTHSTFKQYLKDKWDMTPARAYQLCEAAEVVNGFEKSKILDKPLVESHAAELAKVPEEKREEVLSKAKSKGKVTAATIKEAAQPEPVKTQDAAWKAAGLNPDVWNPKEPDEQDFNYLVETFKNATTKARSQFRKWLETN